MAYFFHSIFALIIAACAFNIWIDHDALSAVAGVIAAVSWATGTIGVLIFCPSERPRWQHGAKHERDDPGHKA